MSSGRDVLLGIVAGVGVTVLFGFSAVARAQSPPDLSGMWSDVRATAEDVFCAGFCTDVGIERLNALLDDPANDSRTFTELRAEAQAHQIQQYFRPRLTAAALETFPLDPAEDPGFLRCEPWGLARQINAPHQLEVRQFADRVELRYGEWDARRTVYLDGRSHAAATSPTPLGHSVGRYENGALIVETTGIGANITSWRAKHSDQLRTVERYERFGDRLELITTIEDPWSLKEPVVIKKHWAFAPDEQIFPYEDCEIPTEFRRQEERR